MNRIQDVTVPGRAAGSRAALAFVLVLAASACGGLGGGSTPTAIPGATSTAMAELPGTAPATVAPGTAASLATRAAPHLDEGARELVGSLAGKVAATREEGAFLDLCLGLYASSILDLADECFRTAHLALPQDARPLYYLGRGADQTGDTEAARGYYRQAVAAAPDLAFLHWRLGLAELALDNLDGAGAAFQRSLDLDPAALGPQAGLARVDLQRGDAQAAVDRLVSLEAGNEGEIRYLKQLLATAFERVGRSADAARLRAEAGMDQTLPVAPWTDPWIQALDAYAAGFAAEMRRTNAVLESGDAAAAIPMLEDMRKRYPDHDEVVLRLATAYGMHGDLARARELFQQAAEREDSRAYALESLSRTYLLEAQRSSGEKRQSLVAQGLAAAEAAIADPQSLPSAQGLKGDALALGGDREGALAAYRLAAAAEPRKVDWQLAIARMLLLEKRWDEAAGAARAAAEIAPEAVQAWAVLAFAQAHLDDPAAARQTLEQALKLAPGDKQVLAAATEVAGMEGDR
jgi:tetratricopeptide (TPR) repeat protein